MELVKRNWLAELRNDIGLTQEAVAKMAKIERSTYTKAENGYPVRVKTAKSIASVLGVNWTLFFDNNCDLKGQRDVVNHN
ncbi:helix-turn-helix transcriptional regulator [Halalkalibacter krulwichiae]|uniref:Helix-turn-helix protein n=1 Tax=Halalkalibacter krulwichiae TaxID=199441 RepID=A0A1X9MAZ5_9BACI|nr:helix-turn-helix transcriptional regulator [Halalkalibacter krulwichiae]ARK28741.1 helix-turn-helix protein [Halalkalibacter krulwichiae]